MQFVSPRSSLDTYRYLRIGMPALLVLLGVSIFDQIRRTEPDCWLGSISAYYYTSARAVFVACLCAVGACLVIYRGSTYEWRKTRRGVDHDNLEDFLLNISGFLAFVVALVPTPLKGMDIKPDPNAREPVCKRSNVPSETQLADALENNVRSLLIALTVVLLILIVFKIAKAQSGEDSGLSVASILGAIALALAWALHMGDPEWIRANAHIWAAFAMFAGIVSVVLLNVRGSTQVYRIIYVTISVLLLLTILVLGGMWKFGDFDHVLFWLEASVIFLFGIFWVVQTVQLWNVEQRRDLVIAQAADDALAFEAGRP